MSWATKLRSRIVGAAIFVILAVVEVEIGDAWHAWRDQKADIQSAGLLPTETIHPEILDVPPPDESLLPAKESLPPRPRPWPGSVRGVDRAGHEADFFYVVSQEFHWKKGEEVILDAADRKVEMEAYLATKGLQNQLSHPGLIAVGTASCEEEEDRPLEERKAREEDRALKRGELLVQSLRTVLPRLNAQRPQEIYLLSLGQFRDTDCGARKTDHQRKVALIAITWMEQGVNLKEALSYALKTRRLLGFDPQRYSLWPQFVLDCRTSGREPPANNSLAIVSLLNVDRAGGSF